MGGGVIRTVRENTGRNLVGGGVIQTGRDNTGRNLGWVVGLSGQGERTQAETW